MRAAVVGAGIHGVCTALALADRGHQVTIIDRWPPGHKYGSSHGRSRIIRKAYPDTFHTRIMSEAYGLWNELEARCSRTFVYETGLLYFGRADSPQLVNVERALRSQEVEMYDMSNSESSPRLEPDERGVFTPEAGWVNADVAVSELFALAISSGATFDQQELRDLSKLEDSFDVVVLACGAWIRTFVQIETKVRVQTVAYVEHQFNGPVWIEDGPDFLYGFPTAPNETSMKIGVHGRGLDWNIDEPRPGPDSDSLEIIQDFVQRRFGVISPRIVETVTCLYTMTPDEMFRWGRCSSKSLYVSACSGHGFKFGPWIGRKMADLAEGSATPEAVPEFCRR